MTRHNRMSSILYAISTACLNAIEKQRVRQKRKMQRLERSCIFNTRGDFYPRACRATQFDWGVKGGTFSELRGAFLMPGLSGASSHSNSRRERTPGHAATGRRIKM